jgi:hypothetical protein
VEGVILDVVDYLIDWITSTQLRKTSARRQSDEGCEISYRLKWGTLPPNVSRSS